MSSILESVLKFFDGPHAGGDPERFRRARLLTGFGILGAVFGTAYSAFYLSVGHYWGALVIILCSACFALMPWLLRWGWGQPVLAEAYSIILVIGFFALCWLEDGLHGHAIAWLASVPLCALLLIGLKGATRWGVDLQRGGRSHRRLGIHRAFRADHVSGALGESHFHRRLPGPDCVHAVARRHL